MTSKENLSSDNLPIYLLKTLEERGTFDSNALAAELNLDHQKLVGALKSLQITPNLVDVETIAQKHVDTTNEGTIIVNNNSHEFNVFQAIDAVNGSSAADLNVKVAYADIGIKKALQNGWIKLEKGENTAIRYYRKVDSVVDTIRNDLLEVKNGRVDALPKNTVAELKKRKLISESSVKVLRVKKGSDFKLSLDKPEMDLTAELINSGEWKTKSFKKYNYAALGTLPASGHLHPLLKVRSEFRDIFFQMGFSEMPTNRYVESSFWNFDALFQPQQHPARDAQDTFFISEPAISTEFPAEYLEKVKVAHINGGDCDSVGYQYDWDVKEAQKNVLRTHTTAVSARQLYKYAQMEYKPLKMFSIDRVYRNETLDATHLAEFHQVEGVIAEKNLSLGHVIGLFTEFYRKCGITNLRFKPTYNPYTEPSMEIFAFHDGLKKWVEIGNSGMFRPEMLLPMGFPADVNVAGFGLSLERPTMIRYGISNIRELFGHKINLEMVYRNPICRLEK